MRPCILIVEDDPITRELLRETLVNAGIDSIMAEDGASMWKQMLHQPQAVILDLCLPDTDGLELLRQLRRTSDVPVLIHSTRSDEIERILGIEIGADDFLPKPCNLRELLARIRALLRRTGAQPSTKARSEVVLQLGGRWTLDIAACRLIDTEGQAVELNGSAYLLITRKSPYRVNNFHAPYVAFTIPMIVALTSTLASCAKLLGAPLTEENSSRRFVRRDICLQQR